MSDSDRPSAPLLKMLREFIKKKGLNTAAAANAMKVDRARARRVLSGSEAMTVDELLTLGGLLELSPEELSLGSLDDEPAPPPKNLRSIRAVSATGAARIDDTDEPLIIDPWGNQCEQLFKTGFALGCDIMMVLDTAQLDDSGMPKSVLSQWAGRDLPIKLDAAYHSYNNPQYADKSVTVTLSFDALYTCSIPWSAFRQVIFFPLVPDASPEDDTPDTPTPGARPMLRLVT